MHQNRLLKNMINNIIEDKDTVQINQQKLQENHNLLVHKCLPENTIITIVSLE